VIDLTYSPMSPSDTDFVEFDFTAVLQPEADLISGSPMIAFDPPGPNASEITVLTGGLVVKAKITGVAQPGHWVRCDVVTVQGRDLTRSKYQPVEQL
jgi:formylmethanofuran dehydrogenase subunit B